MTTTTNTTHTPRFFANHRGFIYRSISQDADGHLTLIDFDDETGMKVRFHESHLASKLCRYTEIDEQRAREMLSQY